MHRARRLIRSHWHALDVLAATLELPRPALPGRRSSAPTIAEHVVGDQPTTVVRPPSPPPWPAMVFANGATPDGRRHPVVLRLGAALARRGYAVYIPDLPGIVDGVLTPTTLGAAIAGCTAVADSPQTRGGRVGLVGVSVGGTLALLAAADDRISRRVSVVACVAPFTDLERVILLATTGMYRGEHGLERYAVPPELAAGLGRSIEQLGPVEGDPAVRALLVNRDPARFDDLYRRLPAEIRDTVHALSPRRLMEHLVAPVEIATSPRDRYFPVDESLALARNSNVRVTITPVLAHARPHLDPRSVVGVVQLERFFARSLAAAAA